MWKAIHALVGLEVDGAVGVDNVAEFVFGDDLLQNVPDVETNVLRSCHGRVEVDIGNIQHHEFCTMCRDDTVQKDFGDKHVDRRGCYHSWVINSVAAHDKASAIGFLLFRSDCTNKRTIGHIVAMISWNGRL